MGDNKNSLLEIQTHIMGQEITLAEIFPRNTPKLPKVYRKVDLVGGIYSTGSGTFSLVTHWEKYPISWCLRFFINKMEMPALLVL